jgi:hypothetical protein
MKMTVGAERKKVMVLGGLLVVALAVYLFNSSSTGGEGDTSSQSSARPGAARPATAPLTAPPADARPPAGNRSARVVEREFRPSPRPKKGEVRPDPTTVDPTLRLDILAKLQTVNVEGAHRSIFDFGQAPPPPAAVAQAKGPKAPSPLIGPAPPPKPQQTANATPPKPQAPPVPFKFYGYITNQPNKRAFFMEGEDIHVVREGDVVKNRYKIVRIGVNSVVVEDMQFQSQQTLPLEEQPT